jgi:mono/diheme cytochrome c family protein
MPASSILIMARRGLFAAILAAAPGASASAGASVGEGRAFVLDRCARCHAVEASGASPLAGAPPLRDLHQSYPVENLAEAFAEGIVTGHPDMPQFVLTPEQIDAVISYLRSLE